MILLNKISVTRLEGDGKTVGYNLKGEGFIAVDPWSVITVEKLTDDNGRVYGSNVFVEHRGMITVADEMTDVIRSVEFEIKDHSNGDV